MGYSQNWLEDPSAIRCILVEVTIKNSAGTPINLYLSTAGFITNDGLYSYDPIISNNVSFTETLNIDNTGAALSYGDIEVLNFNGDRDSWLDPTSFVWPNGSIKIYYGDPNFSCNTHADIPTIFQLIFDGTISDIDSKSRDSLNIKLVDKMQRLNTPITEHTLGTYGTWSGGQPNKDNIVPLVIGEAFNYEPLLIDPSQLEYQWNDGPSQMLIEIRDNGVPIYTNPDMVSAATVDLNTGKFKLNVAPVGTITVSAKGTVASIDLSSGAETNTYFNSVKHHIATICRSFGNTNSAIRLSADEIDYDNFSTISSPDIGYVINDRENVINVCQALASSINAQLYFNRLGKLQLLRLIYPTTDPIVKITDNDILHHSLSISSKIAPIASVNYGYAKNWTVQSGLQTGIPASSKLSFATEWWPIIVVDAPTKALYNINILAPQKDTYLIRNVTTSSVINIANSWLGFFKVPRTVYKFTGTSKLLSLKLGQAITLVHNRFNLYNSGAGFTGQVVGLTADWLRATIDIEVLI